MYNFKNNYIVRDKKIVISNQEQVRAVDSLQNEGVVNIYGHLRSDFAILTETCNSVEFAKALQQMQASYQENSSQFDGMTFEQMIATVRPRWCQLPGEVDRFEQFLIDNALEFYKALRAQIEEENKENNLDGSTPEKPAILAPSSVAPSE